MPVDSKLLGNEIWNILLSWVPRNLGIEISIKLHNMTGPMYEMWYSFLNNFRVCLIKFVISCYAGQNHLVLLLG